MAILSNGPSEIQGDYIFDDTVTVKKKLTANSDTEVDGNLSVQGTDILKAVNDATGKVDHLTTRLNESQKTWLQFASDIFQIKVVNGQFVHTVGWTKYQVRDQTIFMKNWSGILSAWFEGEASTLSNVWVSTTGPQGGPTLGPQTTLAVTLVPGALPATNSPDEGQVVVDTRIGVLYLNTDVLQSR